MKLKFVSFLVALMLALVACNGGEGTTTTTTAAPDGTTTTAAGASTTAAASDTTAAGGASTTAGPTTTAEPFAMPAEGEVLVTINGTDLATSDVLEILGDEGAATVDRNTFINALSQIMQFRLIGEAAVAEYDVQEPGQDRIDGFLEENFPGQSVDEVANTAGFPSPAAVNEAVIVTLMLEDVEAQLANPSQIPDEEAQTAIDNGSLTEVCAHHILVASEQEANDAIGRIEGGEDFAAVAQEVSTDTGSGANGGDLGCTNPSTYVPEFAEAALSGEIGELTGPVETQFGFHVIRVDERNEPNLEEAKQQLAEEQATTQSQTFLETTFNEAQVEVHNESFGVWDPAAGGLVPAGEQTPAPE